MFEILPDDMIVEIFCWLKTSEYLKIFYCLSRLICEKIKKIKDRIISNIENLPIEKIKDDLKKKFSQIKQKNYCFMLNDYKNLAVIVAEKCYHQQGIRVGFYIEGCCKFGYIHLIQIFAKEYENSFVFHIEAFLKTAIIHGKKHVVKFLLNFAKDLEIKNKKQGWTANWNLKDLKTKSFRDSIEYNQLDILKFIVKKYFSNENSYPIGVFKNTKDNKQICEFLKKRFRGYSYFFN